MIRKGWVKGALCCAMGLWASAASALTLTVQSVTEDVCENSVTVAVSISDFASGQSLTSVNFDLTYDTTVLDFVNMERGPLVETWGLVAASEPLPATVRVGLVALLGTPISAPGDLAFLNFTRTCPQSCSTDLVIAAVGGGAAGAARVDGVVACGSTGDGEGTVDGEGDGAVDGEPDGAVDGEPDGAVDGEPDGAVDGEPDGAVDGEPDGAVDGEPDGAVDGEPDGAVDGEPDGAVDGEPDGAVDGEPEDAPPVAVCQNITIDMPASGFVLLTAAQVDGGSTDDNGIVSRSVNPTTFFCNQLGANTVTLTVRDAANQTSTCTATVTIRDVVAPIAACKTFSTILDEQGTATITVDDVNDNSRDACGVESIELSQTEFDCDDIGANTVTLTVTDNNGNVSTCDTTVTVADPLFACVQPPTFTLSLQTQGSGTATVETEPNAPDGVSYTEGTQVTLSAQGAEGWVFDRWQGDIGDANASAASITVSMTQNRNITAVFEEEDGGQEPVNFGCRCVAFEGEDGSTGCRFVGLGEKDLKGLLGEFFLTALTIMVLLLMTAYQKRFW